MPGLEYSADALNTLNRFYGKDRVVFVEGEEDIQFWECVFSAFADYNVEFQELGGSTEIDKIVERIVSEDLNVIAARDADFLALLDSAEDHPNVLYTYGYSIENSIYVSEVLHRLAHRLTRSKAVSIGECREWLNNVIASCNELCILAVANHSNELGLRIFPTSAARLLCDDDKTAMDETKVRAFAKPIAAEVDEAHVTAARDAIDRSDLEFGDVLNGHFLSSAAYHFIISKMKSAGRAAAMSADVYFALAIQIFAGELERDHPHSAYYAEQVSQVMAE